MTRDEFIKQIVADLMDIYLKGVEGKTTESELKTLIETKAQELADSIYGKV